MHVSRLYEDAFQSHDQMSYFAYRELGLVVPNLVIIALGQEKQESQEFKAAWAT